MPDHDHLVIQKNKNNIELMNWSTYTKNQLRSQRREEEKNDIPVENKKKGAFTYNNFLKNRVQKLPISINFESKNNNKENEIGNIYICT